MTETIDVKCGERGKGLASQGMSDAVRADIAAARTSAAGRHADKVAREGRDPDPKRSEVPYRPKR